MDQFSKQYFKAREAIAPSSFLAQLPTKMLVLPSGGVLAVVGHIERAWGCSFKWEGKGFQTETFESTLEAILGGKTVGHAIEYFNNCYAELASDLSLLLEDIEADQAYDPYQLAMMWTANNDARGWQASGNSGSSICC